MSVAAAGHVLALGYLGEASSPIPLPKKGRRLNSPKPVLLLLPQVEIPLDHVPNVLGLLVRELGEVQLLARGAARHHGAAVGHAGLPVGSGPEEENRVCSARLHMDKEGRAPHSFRDKSSHLE